MRRLDMQVPLLLRRGIRRGWTTLLRERGWMTTLGALTGVLLLAQLLLLGAIGVHAVEQLLRDRTDLRLEVHDTNEQAVREFFTAVQSHPTVTRAQYVTREQVYEQERTRDPELVAFLDEMNVSNPFSDTVVVTLRSLTDYNDFTAFLRQPKWAAVVDPTFLSEATSQEHDVRIMLRLTQVAKITAYGFLGLMTLILLFVLIELVRRRALGRSEELFVERLVGARDVTILVPFAAEGFLLLALSLLISIAVLALLFAFSVVSPPLFSTLPQIMVLRAEIVDFLARWLLVLIAAEALALPIIAVASAWIGLRPLLGSRRLSLSAL